MTTATTLRRMDPATPLGDLPRRWTPRPRAAATLSTSDVQVPVTSGAYPDVLLARLYEIPPGDAGRVAVRAGAIEWYLPMSVYLARRFGGRGEPVADLAQVAAIGLIKAVDRYDPTRGVSFASYAIPTIVGEIKRYFRDAAWTVRVPRRLQELGPQLVVAVEELEQALHRSPTTAELAARLGVSREEIREARRCADAYRPRSFGQPGPDGEVSGLIDRLGGPDVGIEAVERRETLRLGLAGLSVRQRRVIALRFVVDLTQQQIATRIGVSQMQVSRLLVRALAQLRDGMRDDVDSAPRRADAMCQVIGSGPASGC
ncbi:SigB/SigF/SigG family RNA polymerase sigma factor [Dactylosporangium sp. McL0621]|uniref:SigB/SigF/SigG family RNA polymerase sigma factor n=1 Tax=Dactylosporangium sp. McL0621 TaxID=3415678 RepID=UPI003CF3DEE3